MDVGEHLTAIIINQHCVDQIVRGRPEPPGTAGLGVKDTIGDGSLGGLTQSVLQFGEIGYEDFAVAEQKDFVFSVGASVDTEFCPLIGTVDHFCSLDSGLFFISKGLLQEFIIHPAAQGALFPRGCTVFIMVRNGVQAALAEQQAFSVFLFQDDPFDGLLTVVRIVVLVISAKGYSFTGCIVNVRSFRTAASDIKDMYGEYDQEQNITDSFQDDVIVSFH